MGWRRDAREKTGRLFKRVIKKYLKNAEKLTVSEWAEKYRVLDESSNLSGKWSNDITPYLIGIMDAFHDPFIREIYFCKATQVGGTEALINILGYLITQSPAPSMIVYPSDDLAKDVSNDKLKPAFRLIPEIKKIFFETNSKELRLKFKNMVLYLRGSNSPSKLASKAIKYLFFDEIDKMEGATKKEASPYKLAMERIKTYKNQSKVYACSTPTLKDNYIWSLYENADEVRHYFVPCPYCSEYIELKWENVVFEKDEERSMSNYERAQTANYICQKCNHIIKDADKPKMLKLGKWVSIKKRGIGKPKTVSFHINSLYSVFVTWASIVEEFLKSKDNPETLQNFVNSWLGEPWEDTKVKTSIELVLERQTEYEENVVPDYAEFLTGGVDVQENSVYWVIRAWGAHITSQNIAHGQALNLTEIEDIMNLSYYKKDGTALVPEIVFVDSGDQTDMVYNFCLKNNEYIYACKSSSKTMDTYYKISVVNKEGSNANGIKLIIIDSGKYKDMIVNRMRRVNGKRAWMVYKGCDEEYAKQVTAEHKISVKTSNGSKQLKWVKKASHADNHYLDAEVYAMAAADILGVRRLGMEENNEEEKIEKEQTQEEKWIEENEGWI